MILLRKNDGEATTVKTSKIRKTKISGKKKTSVKRPRDASDSDIDESKRSKPDNEHPTEQSGDGSEDSESSVYSGEF